MTLESDLQKAQKDLRTVNQAQARGQSKGSPSPCEGFRSGSQDCAVWKSVQNLPSKNNLENRIANLKAKIEVEQEQNIVDNIQEEQNIVGNSKQPQKSSLTIPLLIGAALLLA